LGPTNLTSFSFTFNGYAQPTLVAFSPFDTKTLVAAGADSGVFLSFDTGATWKKVTDNSGTAGNPHVPRAKFASFDRGGGNISIFIGTQGRGVWRIDYPDPAVACQQNCKNTNNRCVEECSTQRATCNAHNQDSKKQCLDPCGANERQCMKGVSIPGNPTTLECAQAYHECADGCDVDLTNCGQQFNQCTSRCGTDQTNCETACQ
jgi:hypothetical protein